MMKQPPRRGTLGKNGMLYVVHAKPGAQIALGLKAGTTRDEFEKAIHAKPSRRSSALGSIFMQAK